MREGFVKIYGDRLIRSSLWDECPEARLVFLAMLAIADETGFVDVPNVKTLARVLNLRPAYVQRGLDILEAPDEGSRTGTMEGRRVVREGSGWRCVNYEEYREFRTKKQEQARIRVQRHRDKTKGSVTSNACNAPSRSVRPEAEAEAEAEGVTARARVDGPPHDLGELRPDVVIQAVRVAMEHRRPELGFWQPGKFAERRAREWCDNVPPEQHAAALAMLPAKATAYAAQDDDWLRKRGWPLDGFLDRWHSLAATLKKPKPMYPDL